MDQSSANLNCAAKMIFAAQLRAAAARGATVVFSSEADGCDVADLARNLERSMLRSTPVAVPHYYKEYVEQARATTNVEQAQATTSSSTSSSASSSNLSHNDSSARGASGCGATAKDADRSEKSIAKQAMDEEVSNFLSSMSQKQIDMMIKQDWQPGVSRESAAAKQLYSGRTKKQETMRRLSVKRGYRVDQWW